MKRTLVLIRHAKSDWNIAGQPDFERSLNDRGKRDAPMMGQRLKDKILIPDLILSSSAKRAVKTAQLIAAPLGYDKDKIQYLDKLYHAPPVIFEEVLATEAIDDEVKVLFMVAHNPGISQFAFDITNYLPLPDMPTCGMVAVQFEANSWTDFADSKHTLLFFDYPKNL